MSFQRSIKFNTNLKIISGKPDLTPIVDVLFLLLIFFMLSSSFVQVSGVKVELPEIASSSTKGVKKFVITIDKNSKIWFNDQPQTIQSLKEELLKVKTNTIVIRADKNAIFNEVAKIMAIADKANLNAFIAINSAGKTQESVLIETGDND
jgi:biopolymer transport protein ExbD